MSVHAAIDIGSNSLKLLVVAAGTQGGRTLLDRVMVTRLSEGLEAGRRLAPAAMARNLAAIEGFVDRARKLGAESIVAGGTMALRRADNRAEFIDALRRSCGLEVTVVSGEEEAELTWLGLESELGAGSGPLCVVDSGGGSTEFIHAEGGRPVERLSLPVGSRQSTERWLPSDPVRPGELARLRAALGEIMAELDPGPARMAGVGGTVTSLAAVSAARSSAGSASPGRGRVLGREELERQIGLFRSLAIAARRDVPGLLPARADVILAGAAIIAAAMDRKEAQEIIVSHRGLRHGLIRKHFGIEIAD